MTDHFYGICLHIIMWTRAALMCQRCRPKPLVEVLHSCIQTCFSSGVRRLTPRRSPPRVANVQWLFSAGHRNASYMSHFLGFFNSGKRKEANLLSSLFFHKVLFCFLFCFFFATVANANPSALAQSPTSSVFMCLLKKI